MEQTQIFLRCLVVLPSHRKRLWGMLPAKLLGDAEPAPNAHPQPS